jgi:hypothetical protein
MMSAWEADGSLSGCMTTWESENDGPIEDMLEDIFYALDRLGRSDDGKSVLGRSAISV